MDTYILKGDEVVGPLTRDEVLRGIDDGSFSINDLCAREGWSEWKKLGDLYKERPVDTNPAPLSTSEKKKIIRKARNWRDDAVTERQKNLIKSRGKRVPKTKGAASDLISSLLGTGPTPRQLAKLKFLKLHWTTVDEAYALLDAVEDDPSYAESIADWDKQKVTLYPDLYEADGSYKNDDGYSKNRKSSKREKKKKSGCITVIFIAFAALFVFSQCSHENSDNVKSISPPSTPTPQPGASRSPVRALPSPSAPQNLTPANTPEPFPESRFWPDKVHILKPITLSGVIAGGSIKSTISAGTLLPAELSSDHKTLVIHNLDLSEVVPIEETDFLDRAKKAAQEQQ